MKLTLRLFCVLFLIQAWIEVLLQKRYICGAN